ncbi:unnamed protein product [Ixodes persulcatus]
MPSGFRDDSSICLQSAKCGSFASLFYERTYFVKQGVFLELCVIWINRLLFNTRRVRCTDSPVNHAPENVTEGLSPPEPRETAKPAQEPLCTPTSACFLELCRVCGVTKQGKK